MAARLRHLMIVLLMLALPWQGVAAAGMRLCEAGHGDARIAAASGLAGPAGHAGHQMHAPGGRHSAPPAIDPADHAAGHPDSAAVDASAVPADASADSSAGDGSCSACAACCVTAVPAASTLQVEHPRLAPSFGGVLAEPDAGFQPGGLERPPRSV